MLDFSIDITEALEDGTEETRTINAKLLTEPSEITLRRWASYFEEVDRQPDWFKVFHFAQSEEEKQAIQKEWTADQWRESYLIFGKLCLLFVEGATLNELVEMPIDGADGLFALFLLVANTVYGYKPKERESFEWKGRKFKAFVPVNIAGVAMAGADMSVRDAVNALQLEHAWQQNKGVNDYNINVGVLAALTREVTDGKVEKPPVDGPSMMRWQFERQELFEDIPMDIALDVVFFSTLLNALSLSIPLSVSCLLRPAILDSVGMP